MLNLMVKDLLIQKKTILLGLVYVAVMSLAFSFSGPAMFLSGAFAVMYLLIQTPCAYDDKNHADMLLNSLPVRRETVVAAKFLSVIVYLAIALAEYLIVYWVVRLSGLPLRMEAVSLETFVGLLAAVTLFTAVFYPVYFRFGYMKTRYLNILLFCGLFAAGGALTAAFGNGEGRFGEAVVAAIDSQPDWVVACGIVGIGLALLLISYGLSLRFYQRREF